MMGPFFRWQCKHISKESMLWLFHEYHDFDPFVSRPREKYPSVAFRRKYWDAHINVFYAKANKLYRWGLIECGVSIDFAWLTDKGKALIGVK